MASWETGDGIVELPDGRRVRARGLRRPPPPGPDPQFGVYLLGSPPQLDWPARFVRTVDL